MIEFNNVSFQYNSSEGKVLDNVSFTMTKEDKIAFVGENSAGISALMEIDISEQITLLQLSFWGRMHSSLEDYFRLLQNVGFLLYSTTLCANQIAPINLCLRSL